MTPEINLLPWRTQARIKKKKTKILLIIIFALVLITFLGWFVLTTMPLKSKPIIKNNLPNLTLSKKSSVLNQIKFIGYVHQRERTWGLLLLPDGETKEVQTGTWIASAEARVVSIDEKHLTVMFADGRYGKLQMNGS